MQWLDDDADDFELDDSVEQFEPIKRNRRKETDEQPPIKHKKSRNKPIDLENE